MSTSVFLDLAKGSYPAVAIEYPDLVGILYTDAHTLGSVIKARLIISATPRRFVPMKRYNTRVNPVCKARSCLRLLFNCSLSRALSARAVGVIRLPYVAMLILPTQWPSV